MIEIGGYHSIASHYKEQILEADFPRFVFNSGRNALSFALRMLKPDQVYFPYFTCSSIHKTLDGMKIFPYHLDSNYLPSIHEISNNSIIIVNNYFGNMLPAIKTWVQKEGISVDQIIIDNTHSLSFLENNKTDFHQFFSPRKFLGVTDGGILNVKDEKPGWKEEYEKLSIDSSLERVKWIFNPLENNRNSNYKGFLKYRQTLQDMPVSQMSNTTKFLLKTLDYKVYLEKRSSAFDLSIDVVNSQRFMVQHKLRSNYLSIGIPIVCSKPIEVQKKLAKSGLYVINYWPEYHNDKLLNPHELDLLNTIILPFDIYKLKEHPSYNEIIESIFLHKASVNDLSGSNGD